MFETIRDVTDYQFCITKKWNIGIRVITKGGTVQIRGIWVK